MRLPKLQDALTKYGEVVSDLQERESAVKFECLKAFPTRELFDTASAKKFCRRGLLLGIASRELRPDMRREVRWWRLLFY